MINTSICGSKVEVIAVGIFFLVVGWQAALDVFVRGCCYLRPK